MNAAFHKLAFRHVRRLVPERGSIHGCHRKRRKAALSYVPKLKDDVLCGSKAQHRCFSVGKGWKHIEKRYDMLLGEATSKKYPPSHFALRVKDLLLAMVNQPNHDKMGLLATRLLEAAEPDLIQSKKRAREELRAQLYKLVGRSFLDKKS
jgi:hypothetical protein